MSKLLLLATDMSSVLVQCFTGQNYADIRYTEWAEKEAVVLRVVTSSVMHQFKEIPLLESLLNFQKDVFY